MEEICFHFSRSLVYAWSVKLLNIIESTKMNYKKSAKTSYFTLVELLVVIAVIGILVSMLMPSLKKARDASYQSVSKHNLSQIYKQFMIHVDDNNDRLPGIRTLDGVALYWYNYLRDSFGGEEPAKKILLIPGQSYTSNTKYSYSPTFTIYSKNGNFLSQNGGRIMQNIFQPSEAYLMVESKPVNNGNAAFANRWNELVNDRDKTTSSETTRLNFPYFEKMVNLKAVGAVNAVHFNQIRYITESEW